MTPASKPYFTPEEYLALEREAEYKSEYFAGEIFAMAGATRRHNLIGVNLGRELSLRLRDEPCETYVGDMRVQVEATGLYTYPDVVVVCGEPQFADAAEDTLLNPTLIVEILSPSTEAYDRGRKFAQYQRLASLREYVLVAQDQPRVERYVRQPDGSQWLLSTVTGQDGFAPLASVGCELPLAEVYARVDFAADEPDAPSANPPGA